MSGLLLWAALAAASLGVLMDLFGHWAESPWSRYSLLFFPLCAWMTRSAPVGAPAARLGMTLVALGACAEVLAIGGGFERFGRVGLALALLGMTCIHGLPGWSRRLAWMWVIPLPHLVVVTIGERALPLWWHFGAEVASWADAASPWATPTAWQPDDTGLALTGVAGGVCVMVVLAGFGWLRSARAGAPLGSAIRRSLLWATIGVPIQAACVAAAAVALANAWSTPETIGYALAHYTWWAGAAAGLILSGAKRA